MFLVKKNIENWTKTRKQIGSKSLVIPKPDKKKSSKEEEKKKKKKMNISAGFVGLFGLLSSMVVMVVSVPNTGVVSVLCNSGTFTGGDPFAVSLDYVLKELEISTPISNNYDLYNISPYPNSFAYGHASCNRSLAASDCTTCVGAAKTNMLGSCQMRIGARAVLRDCAIRYEQYPFDD